MFLYYIKYFNLKLNFKLKVDPRTCDFDNLEKFSQKSEATLFYILNV